MEDSEPQATVRRLAIGALIVSLTVGIASDLLFLAAFQFRVDWFLEPERILGAGATSRELFRWASVLDLIGYYVATGVLAYALWRILRPRNAPLADISTLAALGFTVAGGTAAAVLAMVGPMLMEAHSVATGDAQTTIALQFQVLFEAVWRAVWQLFDPILLGAWWLGIGLLLRGDHPGIARLSIALGAVALVGAVITALGLDLARDIGLGVTFTLWTVWWVVLLRAFLRGTFAVGQDQLELPDGAR